MVNQLDWRDHFTVDVIIIYSEIFVLTSKKKLIEEPNGIPIFDYLDFIAGQQMIK